MNEHKCKRGRRRAKVEEGTRAGPGEAEVTGAETLMDAVDGLSTVDGRGSLGSSPVGLARTTLEIEAKKVMDGESRSTRKNRR